jgi:hypothetical protein
MERQELYDNLNQVLDILEDFKRVKDLEPAKEILQNLIIKISYERQDHY